MVKVIDHLQTGKRKFIKGGGRKGDIPLELLDDHKNKEEIRADGFLEKVNTKNIFRNNKSAGNNKINNKIKKKPSKVLKRLIKLTQMIKAMKWEKSDRDSLNKSLEIINTKIKKHPHVRT